MEKKTIIEIPSEFKRLFDDDWREAAVYGGRFSMKSHTVARMLLIKAREKKTRIACFREFQNSIADSSHQLFKDLINKYNLTDFKATNNSIVNTITGSDFLFKGLKHNEQSVKSIEGIDYAWVEEAQTISASSIEILTPTIRKEGSKIIWTYNRILDNDPVHTRLVIEGRPNTLIINVNYDSAEKYGFLTDVILEEIEDDREKRPLLFKHKWLGEPIDGSMRLFDPIALSQMFTTTIIQEEKTKYLTVDPAGTGDDSTVFGRWEGMEVWLDEFKGLRSDDIEDKILKYESGYQIPRTNIMLDGIGLGDSIADRAKLQGITVFKGSFSPIKTDKDISKAIDTGIRYLKPTSTEFYNLRTQSYFMLAQVINERRIKVHCTVEQAEDIKRELNATIELEGKMKKQLISKDEIKKIAGHSPDKSDVLSMKMWYEIMNNISTVQHTHGERRRLPTRVKVGHDIR